MLFLDAGLELQGLTLYRDYNDRARFYYMPRSPRLTVEAGQPMFQLLLYAGGATTGAGTAEKTTGGFLTMTVDLGVPTATLDAVKAELSGRFGVDAMLMAVPVDRGTVRVSALGTSSADEAGATRKRFVENIVCAGKPSMYGDQRAAFTAELDQNGAVIMREALREGGASPVVIVYDLDFKGLMPAYQVSIKIRFSQSYHYLRTRAQVSTLWFQADIDAEMEQLRKEGHIEIDEVNYAVEEQAAKMARQTQLQALAKELAQWTFFKPSINPGTVLAQDRGNLTVTNPATTLANITDGLTSRTTAALTGVGATADVGTPRRPGAAVAIGPVNTTDGTTQPAQPAQPAQPSGQPTQPASGPPTAVEEWNRAGRPQTAFLMRDLSQEERQEITYDLRQVGAVQRTIAPQGQIRLLTDPARLRERIKEINLNDPFFQTIEGTITTSADLADLGVSQIVVKLRYGRRPDGTGFKDEAEIKLAARGASEKYRFFADAQRTTSLEYQVVVFRQPGFAIGDETSMEESEWIRTTTRDLDVDPNALGKTMRTELVAGAIDWTLVRQVQCEVRYKDAASGIDVGTTKILSQQAPTAKVAVRPKNDRVRTVTVAASFVYADGSTETVKLSKAGDEPFIINPPPDSATSIDVRLSDPIARYARVTVQLARASAPAGQVERTVTVEGGSLTATWSYRRSGPDDAKFRYKVTGFLKDGAVREADWVTTDNPLVVVGDRAAGILAVQVLMIGSFQAAGVRMAKVKLAYPDAPTWADPDVEKVFRADTDVLDWRVPMQRDNAKSYRYEVTWIMADGRQIARGPITTAEETLLLDPTTP